MGHPCPDLFQTAGLKNSGRIPNALFRVPAHFIPESGYTDCPPERIEAGHLHSRLREQGTFGGALHLFDHFLDEAERIGVLNQRPNFCTIQAAWNFGIDLEFQGHLAAGKGRKLLDDGLYDFVDIPRRSLR